MRGLTAAVQGLLPCLASRVLPHHVASHLCTALSRIRISLYLLAGSALRVPPVPSVYKLPNPLKKACSVHRARADGTAATNIGRRVRHKATHTHTLLWPPGDLTAGDRTPPQTPHAQQVFVEALRIRGPRCASLLGLVSEMPAMLRSAHPLACRPHVVVPRRRSVVRLHILWRMMHNISRG